MSPFDYCKNILIADEVSEKLLPFTGDFERESKSRGSFKVDQPSRAIRFAFSQEQIKFPKSNSLKVIEQRGKALHFFANHELLAIEMMAQAVCQFRDMPLRIVRSLMGTIAEEQKHFKLYESRMNDFGVEFGDFPLNAFFWTYMEKIETYQSFFAVVSLTFEQANLDFAKHYENLFREIGDEETADILAVVYEDEIKHVAKGYSVLKKDSGEDIWNYYTELLPRPLTPARAKGITFDKQGRVLAGFPEALINHVKDYKSDFNITKRKSWKS